MVHSVWRVVPLIVLVAIMATARGACADEVLLKSGKRLKGKIESRFGGITLRRGSKSSELSWREIDWLVFQTKRFRFMSRIDPAKTRYYIEAFQAFVDAMAKTFRFKPTFQKNWTVQIRLFRNELAYATYENEGTPPENGKASSFGLFRVDYDKNIEEVIVFDDPRDPGETFDTLLHEGTHLVLHLWGKAKNFSFPRWIDEGLAEYFGGASYQQARRGKKASFNQGLQKAVRLSDIRASLAAKKAPKLRELLLLDDAFDAQHYAPSWALIHYFAHAEKGRFAKRLNKFCQNLRRTVREGERTLELFEKDLRVKLPKLEERWADYVGGMRPKTLADALSLLQYHDYKGDANAMLAALGPIKKAHPKDGTVRAYEALAYWYAAKHKKAKTIAEQAIAIDPEDPVALRARAVISYYVDAWDDALDAFAKYRAEFPYEIETAIWHLKCLMNAPKGKGDPKRAIEIGTKLAAYHHDAELTAVIGDAFVKLGDLGEARKRYEAARKIEPTSALVAKRLMALEKLEKKAASPKG